MGRAFTPFPARNPLARLFDYVWSALAQRGRCNALGGMEWYRVKGEWLAAGAPVPVTYFILKKV